MDKLLSAAKRTITGESLFMTHFTNSGSGKKRVAFAAPYPGKIIPIDLAAHGGELLCQKDAFLCAALGTGISIAFTKRFGAGLFGGEGFILQRLQGDGLAFVHSGGTVIEKELKGETIRVDTGCIVAFSPSARLRHRDGRQPEVDVLRRRGPVPGHAEGHAASCTSRPCLSRAWPTASSAPPRSAWAARRTRARSWAPWAR